MQKPVIGEVVAHANTCRPAYRYATKAVPSVDVRLYVADQTPTCDIADSECAGAAANEHSTGPKQAVEHGNNLFRSKPGITAKEGEAITIDNSCTEAKYCRARSPASMIRSVAKSNRSGSLTGDM